MARLNLIGTQTGEARRTRSRFYIAVFWALAVAVHLNASDSAGDSWYLLLVALALLAGATALLLRWTCQDSAGEGRGSYRVVNQNTLLRHLKEELLQARRGRRTVALMLATPSFLMHESDERRENRRLMTRAVEELVKHYQEPDSAVFRIDEGTLAVSVSSADAVTTLEAIADRLQTDVRSWRAGGPGPGSIQLTVGIAEAAGANRSAEALLRRARSALERADSLGTGRYISPDETVTLRRGATV